MTFYKYYSQALYVAMLFFILVSIFDKENKEGNILRMTIIGLFIVFVIWEAKSRYIVNYIPIFVLAEVFGISFTSNKLKRRDKT